MKPNKKMQITTGWSIRYNSHSKRWRVCEEYRDGGYRRLPGAFHSREEADAKRAALLFAGAADVIASMEAANV